LTEVELQSVCVTLTAQSASPGTITTSPFPRWMVGSTGVARAPAATTSILAVVCMKIRIVGTGARLSAQSLTGWYLQRQEHGDGPLQLESEYVPELWRNPPEVALEAGRGGSDYFEVLGSVNRIIGGTPCPIGIHGAGYDATWVDQSGVDGERQGLAGYAGFTDW
jgi:hypothetical protein